MITVANCLTIGEAQVLQIALEAAGIPAFIPDEATAINVPFALIGTEAGVRVQVAEEQAAEAKQIISDAREAHRESEKESSTNDDPKVARESRRAEEPYQDEPEERV